MLETILGVLTSSAGGGLLGVVGSLFKGKAEYKTRKLELEHERAMREADRNELELEVKLRSEEGKQRLVELEHETERAIEVNSAILRAESYSADKAAYGGGWVDKIRGMMRPMITVYLLAMCSYIAVILTSMLNGLGALGEQEALELYSNIINAIVFLCTTAVTWWFGSRPINKR